MSTVRILHAADFHMDSPYEGLTEDKAALRRTEQRLLLSKMSQIVRDENVQIVLLAGDLFDTAMSFGESASALSDFLRDIKVPVFIAPGSSDYYTLDSAYAKIKWPENVYIYKEPRIECVSLPYLGVRVWGAAFNEPRNVGLLNGFEAVKETGTIDLMCICGQVGTEDALCNRVTEGQIYRSGMNYIAFGHDHIESGLRRSGDTWYAWPGCPEGRNFDETGEKFIYIADVSESECTIQKKCISTRKYEVLEINGSDLDNIEKYIPENTENDIYRIDITGEVVSAPNIRKLRSDLEKKFFALEIEDKTTLTKDIWDKLGKDTLRGAFLLKLKNEYDNAETEEEKRIIIKAARWGIAALENSEEVADCED